MRRAILVGQTAEGLRRAGGGAGQSCGKDIRWWSRSGKQGRTAAKADALVQVLRPSIAIRRRMSGTAAISARSTERRPGRCDSA